MSTHGFISRIRKDVCQPRQARCTVLGALLVTLLLLLFPSSLAFAYTPRTLTQPHTFNPPSQMNVALDEVSIVRLLATYSTGGNSSVICTGLGVIVASWTPGNGTDQNNLILTSGNVVSKEGTPCGPSTTTTAKQFVLKSLEVIFNSSFNDGKTPYSQIETAPTLTADSIQCANPTACRTGMSLFVFHTPFANPFVTLVSNRKAFSNTAAQGQPSVQIALAKGRTLLAQNDTFFSGPDTQAQTYRTSVTQYLLPFVVNASTNQGEAGVLTIDEVGNIASLFIGSDSVDQKAITTFLTEQPQWDATQSQWKQQDTNMVQASWRTGIQQYYQQQHFAIASPSFAAAAQSNTNFVVAKEFATSAARQVPGASGNANRASPSSSSSGKIPFTKIDLPSWWPYAGVAVVILLLILAIVLVGLLFRRNKGKQQRLSPGFARDWEAAQKEVLQKQQSGQLSPQFQQYSHTSEPPIQQGVQPTFIETPAQTLSSNQAQARFMHQPTLVDNGGYSSVANQPTLVNNEGYNAPSVPPSAPMPPVPVQQSPVQQPPVQYTIPKPMLYDTEDQTVPNLGTTNEQLQSIDGRMTPPAEPVAQQGQKLGFVAGVRTDPGIKRKYKPNEDSMFAAQGVRDNRGMMQPFGLFVVADGMGGHANGQDASRLAIQTITNYMLPILLHNTDLSGDGLKDLLRDGVQQANQAVHQHNMEQHADMGTTMTAALVVDTIAYIANVGDSRTYLYREGAGLKKITQDHSVVASLVDAGIIKPDDIYTHPKRNQIYRSLGEKPVVEVDVFKQELLRGDKLLLCSDGLWDMVRDPQIAAVLQRPASDLGKTGDALIDAALTGGGDDNVSVIVVQVTDPVNPHDLALDVQFLYSPESYNMPQL